MDMVGYREVYLYCSIGVAGLLAMFIILKGFISIINGGKGSGLLDMKSDINTCEQDERLNVNDT